MDSTLITLISVSNVALVRGSRKSQLQEELTAKLDTVCKLKSEREGIYVQKWIFSNLKCGSSI